MLKIKVKWIELKQDNAVSYIHANLPVNVIVILPHPQVEHTQCQESSLASFSGS